MTNWKDPEHIAQSYIDFIKLEHVITGIYLWEFFINLHYEWSFITRKRKWLWTVGIYFICRFSALLFIIMNLFVMNTNKEINCQAWVLLCEILALIALASGSFLIVVRISAIWERKKHIMILAASVWSVNVGFWIHYTTQSRSTWSLIGNQCLSLSTYRAQPLSIAIFVTDMILLIIMLVGLWRKGELQRSGLWNLLWTQGLTWVALAAFADIPMIVVLHLNLNDPWNLMFQTGALIVLVIGSTRMHRTLTNWGAVTEYVSNRPAAFHGTVSTGGMGFRTGATTHTAASLRPAEVAISMGSEQFTLIQAKLDKTLSVV